jgi:Holliday junction resolvasome RuvABC endonuclease subunit
MNSYPKIVGLDLSLNATGIALDVGHTTIKVPNKIKQAGGGRRLLWLFRQLNKIVDHDTHLAVVEDYALGGTNYKGHHANVEWGGVARLWLTRRNIPYVLVRPTQLKKYATGKGNASKKEMMTAARSHVQVTDDNQADAFWLRQMGVMAYTPIEAAPIGYEQLEVIKAFDWPDLFIKGGENGNG